MTDQLRSDIQDLQDELNQLSHVNPGVDLSAAIAKARALEQSVGDQPSDPAAPSDPAPTDPTQPAPDEPVDQPPANPSQPGPDPSQPNPPAV